MAMPIPVVAALLLCLVLAALAVFQLALVGGAPLGRYAWGGSDRVLPQKRRVASVVAIVLYVAFALLFVTEAGVMQTTLSPMVVTIAAWVVVGYLALGTVMNALSRSPRERWVMTPVSAVLTILGIVIILG